VTYDKGDCVLYSDQISQTSEMGPARAAREGLGVPAAGEVSLSTTEDPFPLGSPQAISKNKGRLAAALVDY
jgi:hypothetical protein